MKKKLFTLLEILIWVVLFFVPVLFVSSLLHPDLSVKKYYTVSFYDINGIIVGSPVNFAGYNVGYVKKIKIDGNRVKVNIAITKKEFKMPKCAVIKIEETGLGGSRSLEVYTCNEPYKAPGVYTTRPKKLNDILDDVNNFSKSLTEGMGNLYLGLNASIGDKDHEDFVEIQCKLHSTEGNLKQMSSDLTTARFKAQKKLPEINQKMEKTLGYLSEIDINPEQIKLQANQNQKAIEKLGKTVNSHSPAEYNAMAKNLYWQTQYLKFIDDEKVSKNMKQFNNTLNSLQNILHLIELNFSTETIQKRQETVENIRKDTDKLLKEDF